jgi:hypothetical protein
MTMCRWSPTQLGAAGERREGGGEAVEATRPTRLPPAVHHPLAATAIQAQPFDSCHTLQCLRYSLTCLSRPPDHHPRAAYAHLTGRPPHCSQSHHVQPPRHQHRERPLPLLPLPHTPTRSGCQTPPSTQGGGEQSSGLPGCPSRFTARPPVSPIAERRQARLPDKPMPERH